MASPAPDTAAFADTDAVRKATRSGATGDDAMTRSEWEMHVATERR